MLPCLAPSNGELINWALQASSVPSEASAVGRDAEAPTHKAGLHHKHQAEDHSLEIWLLYPLPVLHMGVNTHVCVHALTGTCVSELPSPLCTC